MKASIIITTYKRNTFLMNAIRSCLNQNFEEKIEIVVVDDNGKNTAYQQSNQLELSGLIEKHQIKYIVHEKNAGACVARNTGAFEAQGEYLFFLDDDDEFLPDKVSTQVSFLENNAEFDVHACAFLKKRNGKDFPSTDGIPLIEDLKTYLMHGNVYTPMLCIRKDVLVVIGGFEEIPKFQDMYFVCMLLANNVKIFSSKEPLFIQHDHKGERISNKTVANAQIAVDKFREFANLHKELFNKKEWSLVQTRLTVLLATTYYSSNYVNRLKSVRYWLQCFKLSKDKKYLYPLLKCFIPNNWIKFLEKIKSKSFF